MALVTLAGTLAIFCLVIVQVFLPFILGVWGLAAVITLDVSLFVAYLYRRAVRPVPHGLVLTARGLEDRQVAQHEANAKVKKIVGTILVVLFVLGLRVLGWVAQLEAELNGVPALYFAGAALYLIGTSLMIVIFWDYYPVGYNILKPALDEDD